MSIANQARCAEDTLRNSNKASKDVFSVPENIGREMAHLKLNAMGVRVDKGTPE